MYLLFINDLYEDKYIMIRCEAVRSKMNAYVMILNILD